MNKSGWLCLYNMEGLRGNRDAWPWDNSVEAEKVTVLTFDDANSKHD